MSIRQTASTCLRFRYAPLRLRQRGPWAAIRASSTSKGTRQWSTPLAKTLAEVISTTGPIPIAQYMRQCLVSDLGGYYTNTDGRDQFGKQGDFVTSPEISQIFGELVGIWFVTEWLAQGKKGRGVQLVELGPGRGTLMEDALRTIANFKPMASAIDRIVLVEASASLREVQKTRLCGNAPMQELSIGWESKCSHLPGVKILWVEDLKFVPSATIETPLIIAHEFFDALPIHAFQSVAVSTPERNAVEESSREARINKAKIPDNQWKELVVSFTAPPSILNPPKEAGPEFELSVSQVLSKWLYLPRLSQRYMDIVSTNGATVEISPEAQTTAAAIAALIGGSSVSRKPPSGAALIIDYGPSETVPLSTLRGILHHKRSSPFSKPGIVDVSADVDFGALVEAALAASENIEVHGPVEQGDWLGAMGGKERKDMLLGKAEDEETRQRLETGWMRLTHKGPNGMGRLYKVMSIVPLSGGSRRPVGFGGDVVGGS